MTNDNLGILRRAVKNLAKNVGSVHMTSGVCHDYTDIDRARALNHIDAACSGRILSTPDRRPTPAEYASVGYELLPFGNGVSLIVPIEN